MRTTYFKSPPFLAAGRLWLLFLLGGGGGLLAPISATAENYAIQWHTISDGGGSVSNAAYATEGTIGQTIVGQTSGGQYRIDSGFWSFQSAIQAPSAPIVSIALTVTNTVLVSWSVSASPYSLQSATDLKNRDWVFVPYPSIESGGIATVVVPVLSGNRFFRLVKSITGSQ